MISINRAECPDVLADSPTEGTLYNKNEVVRSLWEMQHGKCCYCEMEIPDEGHLKAVEHFQPKSVFKGLKNDWENLLLACAQCNGKKSNLFPTELTDEIGEPKVVYLKTKTQGEPAIIDPSDSNIDPDDHIDFVVDDIDENFGIIIDKNNSSKGKTTIEVIGLYRLFYTKERKYYYLNVYYPLYSRLLSAADDGIDQVIRSYLDDFKKHMSSTARFAAFARAFARKKKLDSRFGLEIPVGAEI